jgi:hypothetical protein
MPYGFVRNEDRYRPYGQSGYPDSPDGRLRSRVSTLARFLRAIAGGGDAGGGRVLREPTVREMLRSQVPEEVAGQGLI